MEIEREVKKMTLGHDFGAGAACLKCKDKCEGFELHFWRKICRNCKCGLAEHDVQMISEENRRVGKLFEDTKYTGLIAKLKTDGIKGSYKGNMVTISLSGPSTAYVVPASGSAAVVPPPSTAAGSVQPGGAAAGSGQPGGAGSGQPGAAPGGSGQPGAAPGGSGQPGAAPGGAGSVHPGGAGTVHPRGAAAGSVQQRVSAWSVPASPAQPMPAGVAAVKASTVPMTVNTAAANVVPVKKDVPMHSVTYEWAPPVANTNKYMAVCYMELLPPEKRPVAGSEGAAYRRQQMACQLPEHDQDPSKCHELTPAEVKQMEQYVRKYKDEALGMGDIMLPEEMFLARAGAAGQGGVGAGPGSGTKPGVGVGGGPGAMKAGGVGAGVGGAAPGGVGTVPGTGGVGGYGPGIGSAGSAVGAGYGPGAGVGAGYGPGAGVGAGYGPGAGVGAGYGPGAGVGAGYEPGAGVGAGYGPGAGVGAGYGPGTGVGAGYGPGAGVGAGSGDGVGAGYGPGAGVGAGYGPGAGVGAGYGPGDGVGAGSGAGVGAGYGPGAGVGAGYAPGVGGGTGAGYGQDAGGAGVAGYGQGVGGAGVGGGIGGQEIGPRDMGTATTAGAMGIPGAPQAGLPPQAFSCNHCQLPMRQGDPAVYAERAGYDKMWHPACFVCCKCSELLVDMIYFWKKGKLYCGRHYGDSEKPRCGGCDELIFSNEYTQAEDQNWHLKHFCCYDCDLILAGETYVMEKDKPVCTPCYMKSHAVKCTACNNPVEPEAQRVSYGDHHWHAEPGCFQCSCCSKCLIGQRFMAMQAFLFCSVECKKQTMS